MSRHLEVPKTCLMVEIDWESLNLASPFSVIPAFIP